MKNGFRLLRSWRFATGLAVVMTALVTPSRLQASSRWETLEAIHRIENPRNVMVPGRHGELGAYQFRPGTWRMHTSLPFEQALDRSASDGVAIRHYEWLRRGLVRHGLEDSPYNIALAWNGGLTATLRGRPSASARDYAERVSNIVAHLSASRVAANP